MNEFYPQSVVLNFSIFEWKKLQNQIAFTLTNWQKESDNNLA